MDGDEKEDAVESRATMLKKVIIIILIVVLQGGSGYMQVYGLSSVRWWVVDGI